MFLVGPAPYDAGSTVLHRGCTEEVRTVTKMQTAAASLVAAIPAGILSALLVMMFLTHSQNLSGLLPVIVGLALVCAAVVVLMPFGILLFSGKAAAKGADKAGAKAVDADDAELSASEGLLADDDGEIGETVVFDPDSSNELADLADSEIDEATDEDVFADEDDFDDEPKKKKGKKK